MGDKWAGLLKLKMYIKARVKMALFPHHKTKIQGNWDSSAAGKL